MTSLNTLNLALEETGIPVAYRAWPDGQSPGLPFICYFCGESNPLFADATVYHNVTNVRVELYTREKDLQLEALVEQTLREYPWQKSEIYISTERCYMILYEIEV